MLLGDRGREDGARQAARRSLERARSMGTDERRATALERSSEQWLAWLRRGLAGRTGAEALAGLWDLLEDLAKAAGAFDTAVLAAQLQVLVDGAIAAAAVDRDPAAARDARELARAAVSAAGS